MARVRAKVKREAATFLDIKQPPMLVVRSWDDALALAKDKAAVNGAYVKVAPIVQASERAKFDSRQLREDLLKSGAAAVTIAPSVVADPRTVADKPDVRTMNAEEHLKHWFATAKLPKAVVKAALDEALTSVQEAGL